MSEDENSSHIMSEDEANRSDDGQSVEEASNNGSAADGGEGSDNVSDDGSDSDESSDDEEESRWKEIISAACDETDFGPQFAKPEHILKEPYISEVVAAMGNYVERHIMFAHDMENEDDTYEQINIRIARYEDEDMPRDEASQLAWQDRRYLVRKMLEKHVDIVKGKFFEGSDEEDSDQDSRSGFKICGEFMLL